jgi:hypothetical protein
MSLAVPLFGFALLAAPVLAQEKSGVAPAGTAAPTPDAKSPAPSTKSPASSTKSKGRVYMKDLEGTWISRDFVERLRATRAPHALARQATGIAIKIQQEGRSYPILITNFQRAVLEAIIDIEPDAKPNSYRLVLAQSNGAVSSKDVTYVYFRGERNADGRFETLSIAEPNFAKKRFLTYLRLNDPLDNFVNRAVIAGKYKDAEGRAYEFSETGEAVLPDRSFAYEVSLDPTTANCELIQNHSEREPDGTDRIGFEWKGPELRLFKVSGSKPPFKCDSKPFAVLTRQ